MTLSVNDLRIAYTLGQFELTAVAGVSFEVAAGETFALLGESGCGKSATALGIMRLLPPNGRILGGSVRFAGEELLALPECDMRRVRGGRMAMIFQEPATSLNPVLTVGVQIGEVLAQHGDLSKTEARQRMLELLALVGISDGEQRLEQYPYQFSGGMKQRVMMAMALAGQPELLIADEPTTALDVTVQAQILDLLVRLQAERGMGILLITHDLGVVARMAHRIGVMYAGELVEVAPREAFFKAPAHPYTQALFSALPDATRRDEELCTIPGQVPGLDAMPAGCRFAERCPHVMPVCREQSPPWREIGNGHQVRCHWQGEVAERGCQQKAGETSPTASQDASLLAVNDLKVHFPVRRGIFQRTVGYVKAVDGISFALAAGRTLALVGESGCGKTTAGKAILQLLPVSSGSIRLGDTELVGLPARQLRQQRRLAQMIFQDPFASLNPRFRVGDIVAEGMQALGGKMPTAEREAAVAALLLQVGLDANASGRYPHEFSGGQRQRIAIARALAVRPGLIVCDEPTSALDVSVQAQILNLLKSLQSEFGVAYLFITHNFAVVEYLAHAVAVMYLGRLVECGSVDDVLRRPQHPYTQALLSAVPVPRLEGQGAVIRLQGEIPSPTNPPPGCHFHQRCPQVMELCRREYPQTVTVSASHTVACHLYH
ncbi:MAG: Oligopeptide/dipeptide transporter, ATP-binding protein C-terminal [Proteobacteria bacterium]|nr:Oligopeptide/dipeptide transporter, ATP-binding protein C-terminal [Pseudomonadota bacterium]